MPCKTTQNCLRPTIFPAISRCFNTYRKKGLNFTFIGGNLYIVGISQSGTHFLNHIWFIHITIQCPFQLNLIWVLSWKCNILNPPYESDNTSLTQISDSTTRFEGFFHVCSIANRYWRGGHATNNNFIAYRFVGVSYSCGTKGIKVAKMFVAQCL